MTGVRRHLAPAAAAFGLAGFLMAALMLAMTSPAAAQPRPPSPAPPGARVGFAELKDNDRVPGRFLLRMTLSEMEVAPAGENRRNAGHHHLLIDVPVPPLDEPIPADFNHIHLGGGQTETEISLPPGRHTLQLLFADHDHVPHNPPVMSERITVEVMPDADDKPRTASPAGARVFFVDLKDGATIPTRTKVRFGIEGMSLVPAGTRSDTGGHHHLLIDTEPPPFDREIPSDFNHVHFGRAQTEAEISLPPGEHTLQLLLGDHDHVPHDPPVMSERIRVRVIDAPARQAQAPAASGRKPSPPDAVVYFIYPRNGETIFPSSTIRFGLRNMGVAPAGVERADTGHHHLLVDVPTPPLDGAIPADLNHIHLGGGQTEYKVTLPPGEHTLQLILADDQHVPHDPPVMSERIKIVVKGARKPGRRR